MSCLKTLRAVVALTALPLAATGQQPGTASEIVDQVVMQEQGEIQVLSQYSPLVGSYFQYARLDKQLRAAPDGDRYFLGGGKLAKGVDLEPRERDRGLKRKLSEDWRDIRSKPFRAETRLWGYHLGQAWEQQELSKVRIETPTRGLTETANNYSSTTMAHAQTNPFTKAQVADRIRKVEDGVDQFKKYLENRGEDAKNRAQSAQSGGGTTRRQRSDSGNTEARGNQTKQTKDDLENAMDDLNRTTNRLRRKFDPTSNYLETKAQMEQVMDSARRVNQVITKGKYGTQAERYWAGLRTNINDVARCYNLTPMSV